MWSILLLGNDTDNKGFDRVLNGPTSDHMLDPWVEHLRAQGVTFQVGQALSRLSPSGRHIASATVVDPNGVAQQVTADWYVSAVPCEKLAAVLTPDVIAADPKLSNVALLRTEWMNGLMFYLRKRVDATKDHVNFVDSGWAIASISEEQFWKRSMTSYSDGTVKDCLSAIISDWSTPGNFNGRSARDCTPDEIATEAWAQIKAHLNDTDRVVDDAMLHSWFLDPSIIDPGSPNVRNDEPPFIQDPGSGRADPKRLPASTTCSWPGSGSGPTRTSRRWRAPTRVGATRPTVYCRPLGIPVRWSRIVELFQAPWWAPFKAADWARYRARLPHALDIVDTRWPSR